MYIDNWLYRVSWAETLIFYENNMIQYGGYDMDLRKNTWVQVGHLCTNWLDLEIVPHGFVMQHQIVISDHYIRSLRVEFAAKNAKKNSIAHTGLEFRNITLAHDNRPIYRASTDIWHDISREHCIDWVSRDRPASEWEGLFAGNSTAMRLVHVKPKCWGERDNMTKHFNNNWNVFVIWWYYATKFEFRVCKIK